MNRPLLVVVVLDSDSAFVTRGLFTRSQKPLRLLWRLDFWLHMAYGSVKERKRLQGGPVGLVRIGKAAGQRHCRYPLAELDRSIKVLS